MQRYVEDLHDFLTTGLSHCSSSGLHNLDQTRASVSLGEQLLKALRDVLHSHFLQFPVSCDQTKSDLPAEAGLNSSVKDSLVIDLDVLLLDLVEAFLEERIRGVSDKAAVRHLSLLTSVHTLNISFSCSLNGSLVVGVDEVTRHCRLISLIPSRFHSVDLKVLKESLKGFYVRRIVRIDEIEECAALGVFKHGIRS